MKNDDSTMDMQGPVVIRNPPRVLRIIAWFFFLAGIEQALKLGLMLWTGGIWARVIYAGHPIRYILCACGSFLVWHALYGGFGRPPRYWIRFAAKLILLTISLAVSVVIGEIGIRVYFNNQRTANSLERLKTLREQGKPIPFHSTHPLAIIIQPSTNRLVVYELQPNLNMEFGHHELITNNDGMRQKRNYPRERAPDSVRIIGIGDSGMFGWDLDEGQNYMAVLESNLNARATGTVYEVLNLAVPGFNTQLEVETLKYKGLRYKPDIVVVGWCENDFGLPFFMWQEQNYRRKDLSYLYCLIFDREKFFDITYLGFRDQREFDRNKVTPEITAGTDREGVRRALAELKNLGKNHNFKVLVFGPMNAAIRDLCTSAGIPCYNTNEKIPAGKYPAEYAIHYMHPRPGGHRVLAEHLEQDLSARGWLTPPGTASTQERSQ
jgi:hypothetical protein